MIEKRKSLFEEIIGVKESKFTPQNAENVFNAIAQNIERMNKEYMFESNNLTIQPTVKSPNIWDDLVTESADFIKEAAKPTEEKHYEFVSGLGTPVTDPAPYPGTEAFYNEASTDGQSIDYLFDEDAYLVEAKIHIDKTYGGHYAGQYQATSIIIDAGHGTGFNIGNIIKYAKRYGKKDGYNRADILKIIHYATMQLYVHDKENLS